MINTIISYGDEVIFSTPGHSDLKGQYFYRTDFHEDKSYTIYLGIELDEGTYNLLNPRLAIPDQHEFYPNPEFPDLCRECGKPVDHDNHC